MESVWTWKVFQIIIQNLLVEFVFCVVFFDRRKKNKSLFRWSWSWYNSTTKKKVTSQNGCLQYLFVKFRQICPVPRICFFGEKRGCLAHVADELDDDLRIHISWSCLFFTGGGLPNHAGAKVDLGRGLFPLVTPPARCKRSLATNEDHPLLNLLSPDRFSKNNVITCVGNHLSSVCMRDLLNMAA